MKKLIITLFSLIFSVVALFGQTSNQTYFMKALGKKIGELHYTRQVSGEDVYFSNVGFLEVNLLVKKVRMDIENRIHYHAGQFISANNKAIVNGEVHNSSRIEWNGKSYTMQIDGGEKKTISSPIFYSGSRLYFEEPRGIEKAFSEASGIYMSVKPLGAGAYEVTDPQTERSMVYYYENGVQTKVSMKHPLLTVYLVRADAGGAAN
ncbi:MAG: DUF6134 family protein [Bacteroidia bacterium]